MDHALGASEIRKLKETTRKDLKDSTGTRSSKIWTRHSVTRQCGAMSYDNSVTNNYHPNYDYNDPDFPFPGGFPEFPDVFPFKCQQCHSMTKVCQTYQCIGRTCQSTNGSPMVCTPVCIPCDD
ncbi:unnamed protein product [Cochlearia groenlandica]